MSTKGYSGSNKLKIVNDPVYGFITLPDELIFDLIEHRYFQRLRRIKQLGLTNLVYPGALHTRFHHALGAMYLMTQAITILRRKGTEITEEEALGVTIAILLHDIGHGPFSHALETSIVNGVSHEDISALFMDRLNNEFKGKLDTAIAIFNDRYPKRFLHQLVSSQLDMDRLDYLMRDSFFTGVSEGVISSDRIITMLRVINDELVVEHKGIYSVEKFLIARRLMYWQVYLHKTVLSAENLLVNILKRAKELAPEDPELFASPSFSFFLRQQVTKNDFEADSKVLEHFSRLDDFDIYGAVKVWMDHRDPVLSALCRQMIDRNLSKIELQNGPFDEARIRAMQDKACEKLGIGKAEVHYFVYSGSITNSAYRKENERISILLKNGELQDVAQASDQLNIAVLSTTVEKFFLCYPKELEVQ